MRQILIASTLLAALTAAPVTASATTGKGCLRIVNVASWDVLNIRSRPSAQSRVVIAIDPQNAGILHLDGPCAPRSVSWGSRWCPVSYFDGDGRRRGFVKARFVRDSECP